MTVVASHLAGFYLVGYGMTVVASHRAGFLYCWVWHDCSDKSSSWFLYCRVWHDCSGKSSSWFFSRMQITDLQTEDKYFFICDRWLALEEEDGLVCTIITCFIYFIIKKWCPEYFFICGPNLFFKYFYFLFGPVLFYPLRVLGKVQFLLAPKN